MRDRLFAWWHAFWKRPSKKKVASALLVFVWWFSNSKWDLSDKAYEFLDKRALPIVSDVGKFIVSLLTESLSLFLLYLAALVGHAYFETRHQQPEGSDTSEAYGTVTPPATLPPPTHVQRLTARYPKSPPPVVEVLHALEQDKAGIEIVTASGRPFPPLFERLGGMRDSQCRVLLRALSPHETVEQYKLWFESTKIWWDIAYHHIKAERPAWAAQFGSSMALEVARYEHVTVGRIPTDTLRQLIETACGHLERFLERLADE